MVRIILNCVLHHNTSIRFGSAYCNMNMPQSLDLDAPDTTLDQQLEELFRFLDGQMQDMVPTSSMASPGLVAGWSDTPRR